MSNRMRHPSDHDLAAYWKAKGVSEKCELCGTAEWHLVPQPLYLQAPSGVLSGIVNKTLTVVATGCANCGNLRLFPLGVIEQWMAESD